jgi:thiol-disulfide isomerase/thioredoxin
VTYAQNPIVTVSHDIRYLPTTILFKDGVEVDRLIGGLSEVSLLDRYGSWLGTPDVARSVHVKIDTTPPASAVSGVSSAWSAAPVKVTLTATDAGSGVSSTEYRRTGAAGWTSYAAPFVVGTPGASVYEYRSSDLCGNVESRQRFTVRIAAKATITKLSPTSARRAATVTLEGTGFGPLRGSSLVMFGGTRCVTYLTWGATRIRCRVPAKASVGPVKVTVTTTAGASNAKSFTVKR